MISLNGPDETRAQIRDFLVSRRARVNPADVGIPNHGRRRVEGLRREEVAMLAGISVEYYTKLERGDAVGASPSVVNAVANVLNLDDVEREHLKRLMFASDEADVHTRATRFTMRIRPSLARSSGVAGPPTTCTATRPGSRSCATRSWDVSSCPTRTSPCQPTPSCR